MFKKFSLVVIALFTLISCSKSASIIHIAKEQGLSQAAGMVLSQLTNYVNPSYLSSLVESNRVHSVNNGKGIKVNIVNMNTNIKIYAQPLNTVGTKRRLFNSNYLQPGNYRISTSIGTKSYDLSFTNNADVDYFDLTRLTESKANRGLGRIKINLSPEDAKIIIYGTPHKYREGLRLPEGKYKVKVQKKGYITQIKTLSVLENKLVTESFTLQAEEKVEKISVVGSRLSATSKPDDKAQSKEVEIVQVTANKGSIVINPSLPHIQYKLYRVNHAPLDYKPTMQVAAGNYRVSAIDVATQQVLSQQSIIIEALEEKVITFPRDALENRIEQAPVEVEASFTFTLKNSSRARSIFILVDEDGENYRYNKRIRGNSLNHEIKLMEGKYTASFRAENLVYELGEIEISRSKSTNIEFKLE